jgi:hypothetical protein
MCITQDPKFVSGHHPSFSPKDGMGQRQSRGGKKKKQTIRTQCGSENVFLKSLRLLNSIDKLLSSIGESEGLKVDTCLA